MDSVRRHWLETLLMAFNELLEDYDGRAGDQRVAYSRADVEALRDRILRELAEEPAE